MVALYSVRHGSDGVEPGDVLLGLAAACSSVGYALSGRLSREVPGWAVICWALVIALPLTVPATALLWRPAYLSAPAGAWGAFLYLSLFSMLVGFFAWNAGLALGGVANVGQVQLLQVFFSLLITALIVNETIAGEDLVFAGLVTVVVALTGKARRSASAGPKPIPVAER